MYTNGGSSKEQRFEINGHEKWEIITNNVGHGNNIEGVFEENRTNLTLLLEHQSLGAISYVWTKDLFVNISDSHAYSGLTSNLQLLLSHPMYACVFFEVLLS